MNLEKRANQSGTDTFFRAMSVPDCFARFSQVARFLSRDLGSVSAGRQAAPPPTQLSDIVGGGHARLLAET